MDIRTLCMTLYIPKSNKLSVELIIGLYLMRFLALVEYAIRLLLNCAP
jgi:hypothetical protein